LSRRRLDNFRCRRRHRFSRRDLENLAVREIEGAHLKQIRASESSSEAGLEVSGQPDDELFPIACPLGPVLLLLDDAATYGPIRRGHDRIDGPDSTTACRIDEAHDIGEYGRVVRRWRLSERRPLALHAKKRVPRRSPDSKHRQR
jgi:hypothetical protein